MLSLNQAETARWKEMARETAERLWDLGQIAQSQAALTPSALDETDVLTDLSDLAAEDEPLKATG